MQDTFEWAVASVTGHAHHESGQPCQDAFVTRTSPDSLVFVLADGCGSKPFSHLGAKIGVSLAANRLEKLLVQTSGESDPGAAFAAGLERLSDDVRMDIRHEAFQLMSIFPGWDLTQVLYEAFMFTLIGVAMTRTTTTFFACGDGEMIVNGRRVGLETPIDDMPDFLTYGLIDSLVKHVGKYDLRPVHSQPTATVDHLVIASDGLHDHWVYQGMRLARATEPVPRFERFWKTNAFFEQTGALRQNLLDLSMPDATPAHLLLLHDDATLICVRKRAMDDDRDTLPVRSGP